MKTWQMEYYNPYPNIRVRFTVDADTPDEAERKADYAVQGMRRTAFYETTESRRKRAALGEIVK